MGFLLSECEFRHCWVHLISFVGCWAENPSLCESYVHKWMDILALTSKDATTGPHLIYFTHLETSTEQVMVFLLSSFPLAELCCEVFLLCNQLLPCCSQHRVHGTGVSEQPLSDDFAQTQGKIPLNLLPVLFYQGMVSGNTDESGCAPCTLWNVTLLCFFLPILGFFMGPR